MRREFCLKTDGERAQEDERKAALFETLFDALRFLTEMAGRAVDQLDYEWAWKGGEGDSQSELRRAIGEAKNALARAREITR